MLSEMNTLTTNKISARELEGILPLTVPPAKTEEFMNKILVADDNSNERNGLCRLLEHAGYDVRSAADGVEALQKVRSDNFDLMLLDSTPSAAERTSPCKPFEASKCVLN